MERSRRLAYELVRRLAALEGFDIHKDPRMEEVQEESVFNPHYEINERRKKHYRVVSLEKTRQKLEKWFGARDIPIRVVYGEWDQVSAIPRKGVITYQYELTGNDEPPTAWMIVHNLSHAVFDKSDEGRNPHLYRSRYPGNTKKNPGLTYKMFDMMGDMGLGYDKKRETEQTGRVYPTTRSWKTGKVNSQIEAFHEIFAQWVVTGRVKLNGPPETARKWEAELETLFRQTVDEMARLGVVLTNL